MVSGILIDTCVDIMIYLCTCRSQHRTYKLKEQLKLVDMWMTDCVAEVMESTLPPDTAFVIGWPMTNCLAAFSTPEEKILWYNQLSK